MMGLVGHGGTEDNWCAMLIIRRVNMPNMKEMAMPLLQTHVCIDKYLAHHPRHYSVNWYKICFNFDTFWGVF